MAATRERLLPTQLADGQFYGDVHHATRTSGLVFSDLVHDHARFIPEHSHQLSYFSLVLDGHYEEGPHHRLVAYGPYTLIFNPAGSEHEGRIGPSGAKFLTVELEDRWMQALDSRRLYFTQSEMNGGRLLWLALKLRQEYAANRIACGLTAEALVWEMLGELSRWNFDTLPHQPSWWPRLEEAVRDRFRERLSFTELARELGIHPVHLARTCRRVQNRTLGEYVQSLRVQFACKRLNQPDIPLSTIAFDAGFADQSHFTRMFRKFVGTTPARFRESL